MMVQVISSLALSAVPALAEVIDCRMETGHLQFAIDYNHFSPALNPNDPPRRAVTDVTFREDRFRATPFLVGDAKGFEVESGGRHQVFVVQADGSAVFSNISAGVKVTGTCVLREDEK